MQQNSPILYEYFIIQVLLRGKRFFLRFKSVTLPALPPFCIYHHMKCRHVTSVPAQVFIALLSCVSSQLKFIAFYVTPRTQTISNVFFTTSTQRPCNVKILFLLMQNIVWYLVKTVSIWTIKIFWQMQLKMWSVEIKILKAS